jgi:site-specific DNA-methyltransferase (adenine-specific)
MLPINEIIEGDCLEVLSSFPAASVDMVLTSPPYDNLRDYKGYTFNFEGIAKELYRVVKDGGVVVWVVNDATINGSETGTSFKQALYFKEIGFNLHDTMIWEKQTFTATGALKVRYAQVFEYMFVFSKGLSKTFNPIKDRTNKSCGRDKRHGTVRQSDGSTKPITSQGKLIPPSGQRFNVWHINTESNNNNRKHPAVFPESIARDHILSWSNENDIILDPMCGSGTTCVAAKELKRNFIGIEIAQEYANLARERIKNMPTKLL